MIIMQTRPTKIKKGKGDEGELVRASERAKASIKMGKDRAKGKVKGPGLDREEALVVGKTLASTCDWNAMMKTLDELGGRWIEGGTFFHFYVEGRVVTWLSEGFWMVVEQELAEVIVVDGWDLEVATCPTEDEINKAEELRLLQEMMSFDVCLED